MRKLMIAALSAAALSVTACDGPAEEAGEDIDDANNADGVFDEGPAEEYGEMIDERNEDLEDVNEDMMEQMDEMGGETTGPVLVDDGMDDMR